MLYSYLFAISFCKITSCCQVASNYILSAVACLPACCMQHNALLKCTITHAGAVAGVFLRNGLAARCVWNDNKLTCEQSSVAANA